MQVSEELVSRLPVPVGRSLRWSGVVGTPVPAGVVVHQAGRIRTSEAGRWLRFKSQETYEVAQPGFEWRASLKVGPVTAGRAIDSLRDGAGRMHVQLLGLIRVVDATGREISQASLVRWLNETMWFPAVWATDLIRWQPVDDNTALGSVAAGDITAQAEFRFDDQGRLVNFFADRHRDAGGRESAEFRWSTPISEYAQLGGFQLPAGGAAVWHLPEGDFEYIQIRASHIEYTTTA